MDHQKHFLKIITVFIPICMICLFPGLVRAETSLEVGNTFQFEYEGSINGKSGSGTITLEIKEMNATSAGKIVKYLLTAESTEGDAYLATVWNGNEFFGLAEFASDSDSTLEFDHLSSPEKIYAGMAVMYGDMWILPGEYNMDAIDGSNKVYTSWDKMGVLKSIDLNVVFDSLNLIIKISQKGAIPGFPVDVLMGLMTVTIVSLVLHKKKSIF